MPSEEDCGAEFVKEVLAEMGESKKHGAKEHSKERDENGQTSLPLDILRTLHAGSLARWEDRREHEWKLNYAFWAAPAALIASLLFGKHLGLHEPPSVWTVFAIGAIIIAIQLAYLIPVTSRAIDEIELQFEVEDAMRRLDKFVESSVSDKFIGAGMKRRSRWDKGYGRLAPIAVSLTLLVVAGWLVRSQDYPRSETTQRTQHADPGIVPGASDSKLIVR